MLHCFMLPHQLGHSQCITWELTTAVLDCRSQNFRKQQTQENIYDEVNISDSIDYMLQFFNYLSIQKLSSDFPNIFLITFNTKYAGSNQSLLYNTQIFQYINNKCCYFDMWIADDTSLSANLPRDRCIFIALWKKNSN